MKAHIRERRVLWEYRSHAHLWEPLPCELFLQPDARGHITLPTPMMQVEHCMVITNREGLCRLGRSRHIPIEQVCHQAPSINEENWEELGYVTMLNMLNAMARRKG